MTELLPLQLSLERETCWLALARKFSFLEKASCNISSMGLQSNLATLPNVNDACENAVAC